MARGCQHWLGPQNRSCTIAMRSGVVDNQRASGSASLLKHDGDSGWEPPRWPVVWKTSGAYLSG
eukprot:12324411-Prorocentrum_lima.AAC.1